MSKIQSAFITILFAAVAFLLTDRFSSNKEAYPLENEVAAIENEFYLYYLANKSYPKDKSFLSKQATNIIAAYPDRFRWDDKLVFLHFTPRKTAKFAPTTIGNPSDLFDYNSKVYLAHASWNKGFRDHYEATKEELPNPEDLD
jgi:hypothetical protein